MKVVILAGGQGTRIIEESSTRPKPMVEIGPQPILWHIMKLYSHHGLTDFIIACGYKGHVIKRYFADLFLTRSDVTFDLAANRMDILRSSIEPWKVTCVDTGLQSMTGGRIRRVRELLGDGPFCLTYGDGLSDVDISETIRHHRDSGALATMTAIKPPGRFGALTLHRDERLVSGFVEKPEGDGSWINGGFFVLDPGVIDYIHGDDEPWEREPLQALARDGQLTAYRHEGFWQPMDTPRDKMILEELWESGKAPWKVWK